MVLRLSNTQNLTAAQAGYLNQDVKSTASPTFAGLTTNGTTNTDLGHAAQTAGAGTTGAVSRIVAGAGSAAGGGTPGATGGPAAVTAGAGGASDGTSAAGGGGAATVTAGAGGAAHTAIVGGNGANTTVAAGAGGVGSAGAAGGNGGNAIVNAGAGGVTGGGGAGTAGKVQVGQANTASIEIANATDNPVTSFLGTGNINMKGGGDVLNKRFVRIDIVATGGAGGSPAGTITAQVKDLAGNNLAGVFDFQMNSSLTQYGGPLVASGTAFFGAATAGALNMGNGTLNAHVTTDATGLYEGALADAADETAWFSACTATGGVSDVARGCVVVASVPNDATWSA